jgi:DNA-binding response OmpR family regulator
MARGRWLMEYPCRILLADHGEVFRNAMSDSLRQVGYACDCACNAEETAQMMAATQYDALILDIGLPGNAHLQLVRKINETVRGLPIILIADHPTIETAVDAIHLPVTAYLVKPIDLDQLQTYLKQSIARTRLYRAVTDIRSRFTLWDHAVGQLQELLQEPLNTNVATLIGPLLTTTFENIVKSVVDLRHLIDVLTTADFTTQRTEAAELLNKMELTRIALRETVRVLEESKHAFKSKRLGELRHQLQGLLGILEQE